MLKTGGLIRPNRRSRPVDKLVYSVLKSIPAGSHDAAQTIFTATYPCTVTGFKWNINTIGDNTQALFCVWALIKYKEGEVFNHELHYVDGENLIDAESDVIAYGGGFFGSQGDGSTKPLNREGMTRIMRKMQVGDLIRFKFRVPGNIVGAAVPVMGTFQIFIRS